MILKSQWALKFDRKDRTGADRLNILMIHHTGKTDIIGYTNKCFNKEKCKKKKTDFPL